MAPRRYPVPGRLDAALGPHGTATNLFCSRDVYCDPESRREWLSPERRRFVRVLSQLRGFMTPLQKRGGPTLSRDRAETGIEQEALLRNKRRLRCCIF